MTLSITDKVALIYSETGSQRQVARELGISHQRVGRLLRASVGAGSAEGGYDPGSPALSKPDLARAVDAAFPAYVKRAQAQAVKDNLPFDPRYPIFYERLPMPLTKRFEVIDKETGEIVSKFLPVVEVQKRDSEGRVVTTYVKASKKRKPTMVPGKRVAALNTHWIPQKLREDWIESLRKTNRFVSASVASLVNLIIYNAEANQRFEDEKKLDPSHTRTKAQERAKKWIEETIRTGGPTERMQKVFSRYAAMSMDSAWPRDRVMDSLNEELLYKHAPATTDYGQLGQSVYLQEKKGINEQQRQTGEGAGKGRRPR